MKYIRIKPELKKKMPKIIIHFGPNLSEIQPVKGARKPPSKRLILEATEVAARVKPSSKDIGLKSAEKP